MEVYVASVAGLASHHLIFRHGEWHLQATNLLKFYSLLYILVALVEAKIRNVSWLQGFLWSSLVSVAYAICLWASMAVYRLYFHPLHDFPGPRAACISKLWHVAQCYESKNHLVMARLHAQYGPFIRIGTSSS